MKMEKVRLDEDVMLSRRDCPHYNMLYQRVDYTTSFHKEYTGWGKYTRAGYVKIVSVLLVRFICLSCEKIPV